MFIDIVDSVQAGTVPHNAFLLKKKARLHSPTFPQMSSFAAISYMWPILMLGLHGNATNCTDGEIPGENNISDIHTWYFSMALGKGKALSGVSEWLVTASARVVLALLLTCVQRKRSPKPCLLLSVWNTLLKRWSQNLFLCLLFWHLISSAYQCGGVALYAEYQKTNILWFILSVEGFLILHPPKLLRNH